MAGRTWSQQELALQTELGGESHTGLLPDLCLCPILNRLDASQLLACEEAKEPWVCFQKALQVVIYGILTNKRSPGYLDFTSEIPSLHAHADCKALPRARTAQRAHTAALSTCLHYKTKTEPGRTPSPPCLVRAGQAELWAQICGEPCSELGSCGSNPRQRLGPSSSAQDCTRCLHCMALQSFPKWQSLCHYGRYDAGRGRGRTAAGAGSDSGSREDTFVKSKGLDGTTPKMAPKIAVSSASTKDGGMTRRDATPNMAS